MSKKALGGQRSDRPLVARVREGKSMRALARTFRVSLSNVRWWVRRAGQTPLGEVDWSNRPPIPQKTRRTLPAVEARVLTVRQELKEDSALGEYGARAIHRELLARGLEDVPAVRTIGRILLRRGVLDGRRRLRRPPPPRGWYLPAVALGRAEVDSFDIIEGLALRGGVRFEVLSAISIHGGLPGAWPMPLVSARLAVEAVVAHWRRFGVPSYAQFDNDTIFQGGHHGRDSIGRIVRTCLQLGVIPVFAPPRETGFQAAIESFNARWQAKVWVRFYHASLPALVECSERYLSAARLRSAARIEAAPFRRPFPATWCPDLQARPHGLILFLRRTSEHGAVSFLGRTFTVDPQWPHRLVRCEVDLVGGSIGFYALRRRDPEHQPLLRQVPYRLPDRPFYG